MTTYGLSESLTLTAEWRMSTGGPLVSVTGVTIGITNIADASVTLAATATGVLYPATGVNAYTWITPTTPGSYLVQWTGTDTDGDVVTATEIIDVATPVALAVSLADVKAHLNITTSTQDAELIGFIETAQETIEGEVGAIAQRTVTEYVPGGADRLWLAETPILSVTSVTEYGSTLGASYYRLDAESGAIERYAATGLNPTYQRWATGDVVVTYVVGRNPVPSSLEWAIKELTAHLWRSTQAQRGGRARGDGETPGAGAGYALPNRVREVIERYCTLPAVA